MANAVDVGEILYDFVLEVRLVVEYPNIWWRKNWYPRGEYLGSVVCVGRGGGLKLTIPTQIVLDNQNIFVAIFAVPKEEVIEVDYLIRFGSVNSRGEQSRDLVSALSQDAE